MLLCGERKGCNPIRTPITTERPVMSFKTIPLTQSKVTIVDEADYDWLAQWSWIYKPTRDTDNGYAQTTWYNPSKVTIVMARLIMNTPKGMFTDHINGNTLDNRRCNLRVCTRTENGRNRKKHKNSKSKYKGVYLEGRKWRVQIRVNKKLVNVGTFDSEIEAAKAYNEAALKYFGEFAKCNLI